MDLLDPGAAGRSAVRVSRRRRRQLVAEEERRGFQRGTDRDVRSPTDLVRGAVEGLSPDQLLEAPGGGNTIGWLIWHLTRVQDEHIASVAEQDQAWMSGDWPDRFGLDPDPDDIGYGHTAAQVAAVRPSSAELLVDYYDAVHSNTIRFLEGLSAADLDRVVDTNWDPPVTLGVRLVSVVDDDLQHAGQAAYLHGLVTGTADR